jgi:2-deoxy-D-gluconate 3-dehydrogenase
MNLSIFDLTGKVAVVTGGYSGIGFGIAEGLAQAGADIVVCARDFKRCETACEKIKEFNIRSMPIRCDITSSEDVDKMATNIVEEFGKIDVLVNSAGVGGAVTPVTEMSEKDWDMTVDINLKGAFLCSKAAAKHMIKQNSGKIINIASGAAIIAIPNMSAYCASKAGLVNLTRVLALELVRYNIQVNAILPGYFDTPMNRDFFSSEPGKRIINTQIPARRLGNINEIKGLAVLLASPASNFMIGSAVVMDGGQTIA